MTERAFIFLIPSLKYRLFLGLAFFAAFALVDFIRNGKRATRWKEYLFVLMCVAIAIAYGILNDQMTCAISWEYFYYGKELAVVLGPQAPPAIVPLHLQAAKIGIMATWFAGVIIGVSMLIANNPSPKKRQLPYARLVARLPAFVLIAAVGAAIFGLTGRLYLLNWMSEDFRELAATNLWHPKNFMTVYGIHLGGYLGGLLGMVYSIWSIRRERNLVTGMGIAKFDAIPCPTNAQLKTQSSPSEPLIPASATPEKRQADCPPHSDA